MRKGSMGRVSGIVVMAGALVGCVVIGGSDGSDDGAGSTGEGATGEPATTGEDETEGADAGSEGGSSGGPPAACSEDELSDMYTRYVEPFVSGTVPTSCSQCHMTGIDVSLYAQDTPCATMACMVEMGAVDLEEPEQSSLLGQIMMGDPNSSVFDVNEEHQAMLEWIEWSAQCHGEVCADVPTPACTSGTGATSTGQDPIGDCSEDALLLEFWEAVIVDRGRCLTCHSDYGLQEGTFGPCEDVSDCSGPQLCEGGFCRAPGPVTAPHMFEGAEGILDWNDPSDRQLGLNTMYNMIALGMVDEDDPLESTLLTKPLLEGFAPTEIHGPGVSLTEIPAGTGMGITHGGTSKFNFGFHGAPGEPPPPTSGVVDCREQPCSGDLPCDDGLTCIEGMCRIPGSYCDPTYAAYARFVQYYAECKNE